MLGCGQSAQSRANKPPAGLRQTATDTGATPSGAQAAVHARPDAAVAVVQNTPPAAPKPSSVSKGSPGDGQLLHGRSIPSSGPGFVHNPLRPNKDARFATDEVIEALMFAAAEVAAELSGPRLRINDLSLPKGGPIFHHGSHQSGRDVDVLFYLLDADGKPMPPKGIPLDPKGRGWDFGDLVDPQDDIPVHLDTARTWRFLQALVSQPQWQVQRIFVAEHLRTLLMKEAERSKAPKRIRERVGHLMCQPSVPHDDHIHVRFFCTPEDIKEGCHDVFPIYPWHRRVLQAAGVSPTIAKRKRPKKKLTVSQEEARAKAGAMHPKVEAFLDLRETWSKQPHPGRPWCR